MDRLLRLLAAGERVLVRLAAASLVLLVAGQALVAGAEGRWLWALLDPGEGWPDVLPASAGQAPLSLTLALEGAGAAPQVAVTVNGRPMAFFRRRTVTIRVHPGDRLAVDARCCSEPLAVRVVAADPPVIHPRPGARFPLRGGWTDLGLVAPSR